MIWYRVYFSAVVLAVLGGSLRGLWSGPDSELCEADCKHENDGMDRLNYRCNPAHGSWTLYADPRARSLQALYVYPGQSKGVVGQSHCLQHCGCQQCATPP